MGLRESKKIKFIREKGVIAFLWSAMGDTFIVSCVTNLVLHIYPRLILNKSQYKTFKLAHTHFEENYRNIIAISPSFFITNLKKHIAWLESDVFKNQYGGIENLENLSKNTIGATMISILEESKIDISTPPPHYVKLNATISPVI